MRFSQNFLWNNFNRYLVCGHFVIKLIHHDCLSALNSFQKIHLKIVLRKIIMNIFRQKYKIIGIKVDPVLGRLNQLNVEMIFIFLTIMLKNHNWVLYQV